MVDDNQLVRKPSILSAILITCGASIILSAASIDSLAELEYEGKTLAICLNLGVTLSGGGLALSDVIGLGPSLKARRPESNFPESPTHPEPKIFSSARN